MRRLAAVLAALCAVFAFAAVAQAWPPGTVLETHHCHDVMNWPPGPHTGFVCYDTLTYPHDGGYTAAVQVSFGCKRNLVIERCYGIQSRDYLHASYPLADHPAHLELCGAYGGLVCSPARTFDTLIQGVTIHRGECIDWQPRTWNLTLDSGGVRVPLVGTDWMPFESHMCLT